MNGGTGFGTSVYDTGGFVEMRPDLGEPSGVLGEDTRNGIEGAPVIGACDALAYGSSGGDDLLLGAEDDTAYGQDAATRYWATLERIPLGRRLRRWRNRQ
ncbi:hypothetical protein [uncultured Roseobacter sp.]|uniref:hypothetical protein n=1 Tax=uncultured Roseobacter sp. TaxID=114847 RepID=UPI00261C26AB|nr:hypothetical protein [uncultured Roseobacter sp.]